MINIRLRRIINEPKRGIGDTTVNNVSEIASRTGESMFGIMKRADEYSLLSRSAAKLKLFTQMIDTFRNYEARTIAEKFRIIMNESGYISGLNAEGSTAEDRIENLNELYSTIVRYEEENTENASLEGFLEEVALLSDIDNYEQGLESVTLMTLHSAKGLEFPVVFLVGMEDNIFPSSQSIYDTSLLQEERRLAYVGITRAKKKLYITNAVSRMQFGKTQMNPQSRFIEEIPSELIDDISLIRKRKQGNNEPFFGSFGSSYQKSSYSSYNDDFFSFNTYSGNAYPRRTNPVNTGNTKYPPETAVKKLSVGIETKNEAPLPQLKPGDTVLHKKFGKGLVVSSVPMGGDILLEIAFETYGTKKLMAKVAKLEKI